MHFSPRARAHLPSLPRCQYPCMPTWHIAIATRASRTMACAMTANAYLDEHDNYNPCRAVLPSLHRRPPGRREPPCYFYKWKYCQRGRQDLSAYNYSKIRRADGRFTPRGRGITQTAILTAVRGLQHPMTRRIKLEPKPTCSFGNYRVRYT